MSKRNCDSYINALETIYSFLLAIGATLLLNYVSFSPVYTIFLFSCLLLLTRFFFAPSKNIKPLINAITKSGSLSENEKKRHYGIALIIDVALFLFAHSVLLLLIFTYGAYWSSGVSGFIALIDTDAPRAVYAYYAFFWTVILLVLNFAWLKLIDYRCIKIYKTKINESHSNWALNNISFAPIIFIPLCFYEYSPAFGKMIEKCIGIDLFFLLLTFVVIANSLIDLCNNAGTYLFEDME